MKLVAVQLFEHVGTWCIRFEGHVIKRNSHGTDTAPFRYFGEIKILRRWVTENLDDCDVVFAEARFVQFDNEADALLCYMAHQ